MHPLLRSLIVVVAITFGTETRSVSLEDGETRVLDVALPRAPLASPSAAR